MTFNDPEPRKRFLRNLRKAPLLERAVTVLGESGAEILKAMKAAYSLGRTTSEAEVDSRVRIVLRYAARLKTRRDRIKYVRTCINNETRKQELSDWLGRHPDPYDFLSDEEVSDIPKPELRAYNEARAAAEAELDRITGVGAGAALKKRVGREEAARLLELVRSRIDISIPEGLRRAATILSAAAKPTIRSPEKYILACLRNGQRRP